MISSHLTKATVVALLASFLLIFQASAQEGDWHIFTRKSDGQRLPKPAQIISVTESNVQIQLEGAQGAMRVDRTIFSDADQEVFDAWFAKFAETYEPKLDFDVNTGQRTTRSSSYSDTRAQKFQLQIRVDNDEIDFAVEGAKLYAWGLGRNAAESGADIRVLSREEFDLNLAPGEDIELIGNEVQYTYDDQAYSRHGYKFYAYLVVVKNSDENIIATAGTMQFLALADAAFALDTDDYCNRFLEKTDSDGSAARE